MLPVEMYNADRMKPEKRERFLKWYEEHKNNTFNFRDEMEKYCKSDVDILRRGCGEFRKAFLDSDDIDPFLEATTLAQACNKAWRKNSMPEASLGVISDAGYLNKCRYSMKAIRWIQLVALETGTSIRHALNGGEVQIGSYIVDGYDEENKIIYEFLGCLYHGCSKCYRDRSKRNPFNHQTMETLATDTFGRIRELEDDGFDVRHVWECDFDSNIQPQYQHILDGLYPHMDHIKPREALFGGRTNSVYLYYQAKPNEEIKYADICSLYPYVNKYKEYPIGHPTLITQESIGDNIREYRGLIKCKVLPPQGLWMPVLPVHCNKKMVFPLCRTCAEQECQTCSHTLDQRALVGVWTTVELHKALDLGYKLLETYHVWHWDDWSSEVYQHYINKFLKIKQEASGYPDYVKTVEQQEKFMG